MASLGRIGSVHFHPDLQRTFIAKHGAQANAFPVIQCPCLLADRQFSPTCPTCKGTGRFYPPGLAYSVMLLLHEDDSHRSFPEAGTWIEGSIRASVFATRRLCERDKVIALDIKDQFNDEVLTRGLDDTVRFEYGVNLLLVVDRDRLYRPGLDYRLTPPQTVTWVAGGQAPAFGAQYSVKYEAYPQFLCVNDSPRLRVEYHVPQAQEVRLLRWDKLSDAF